MDFFTLLRKKIYIGVFVAIFIVDLMLLFFTSKSLSIVDFIIVSLFLIFLSAISIYILSRTLYFLICIKKFSFINSKKSIKSTMRSYFICLFLLPIFYGSIIVLILIKNASSALLLLSSFVCILGSLSQNKFLLFNDEFIIYDMKLFYIKDVRDCWMCKDCNNITALKILLNNKETLSVRSSFYTELDILQDFLKDNIFVAEKFIEYGIDKD